MRPEQAPPVKHLDFSREIIDLRSRTNLSEGYAAVFATIVIWSTPSLVQYFLNHYYDPWAQNFYRYLVACVAIAPFLIYRIQRGGPLQDATGDKPGMVVVEIPAKAQWCEIRTTVFSWTATKFPFHTSSTKKLNVTDPPIITVGGKVYFDVGHAPKDWKRQSPIMFPTARGRQ